MRLDLKSRRSLITLYRVTRRRRRSRPTGVSYRLVFWASIAAAVDRTKARYIYAIILLYTVSYIRSRRAVGVRPTRPGNAIPAGRDRVYRRGPVAAGTPITRSIVLRAARRTACRRRSAARRNVMPGPATRRRRPPAPGLHLSRGSSGVSAGGGMWGR